MIKRGYQVFLKNNYNPYLKVDGIIGKNTLECTKKFMEDYKLDYSKLTDDRLTVSGFQLYLKIMGFGISEIDGIVGQETLNALNSYEEKRNKWPKQKNVEEYYGKKGENLRRLHLPYKMQLAWQREVIVSSFLIHSKVHDSALEVFENILKYYGKDGIEELNLDVFGGCFNIRRIKGKNDFSMHSWGIAIDFDPQDNKFSWSRERASLSKKCYNFFWNEWEKQGWVSLGRELNFDWMHVQAAQL